MTEEAFRKLGIKSVIEYFNGTSNGEDKNGRIDEYNVFVVWECKTLQNYKMIMSTTLRDGMLYEFTWNGDKSEGYLDIYKKWQNVVIKD